MNPQLHLSSLPIPQNEIFPTNTLTSSGQQDRWAQWFQEGNLVALEQTVPDDSELEALARLCLLHAETQSQVVDTVLIAHPCVLSKVGPLLRAGRADEHQQRSLALRFLNLGIPVKADEFTPPAVVELIQERKAWRDNYWKGKGDQIRNLMECETLVPGLAKREKIYYGKGQPYFHANPEYRTFNVNCTLRGIDQEVLSCRHLAMAVRPEPDEGGNKGESKPAKERWNKRFLREISQVNVQDPRSARLSYQELEAQYRQGASAPAINFSDDHFGSLLVHLMRVTQDFPCSFVVRWSLPRSGHAMRVFMDRSTTAPFWVKVGLYEPNVSGDVSHLKVLPEELHRLNFHDFDKRQVCKSRGLSVLFLQVNDPALSRACAGRFVKQDVESQLASLEQGLSACNVPEIEQAIAWLRKLSSFDASQVKQLGRCLMAATAGERPERYAGFQIFMEGLGALALTPDQMTEILVAGDRSSGLAWLFGRECHAPMVEVLMRCLKKLDLSRDQVFKVFGDSRVDGGVYLHCVHTTMQIFRSGLQGWGFSAEQIVGLLNEDCGDLASKGVGMIVAGMTGLRELGLSSDQIARMLTPRPCSWDKASSSSLCVELQRWDKGGAGSVKAFMAGLKDLSLGAEHNLAILAPEHFGGAEGLRKVLDGVADEARAIFLEDLVLLDMPSEARKTLTG